MPTVNASAGDTLCSLAVAAGFRSCQALRTLPANRPYCDRPLRLGDVVTIPACTPGEDSARGTEVCHEYTAPGNPLPQIRFARGGPPPIAADPSLDRLNVSNYRTDRGGVPETRVFPNANASTFNAVAHADVDAFKVEVFDPRRPAATLDIEIVTREPLYNAAGAITGYQDFAGNDRRLRVTCRQVPDDQDRYRSCYCRLVTDETDKNERSAQTLLVTDNADGSGGAGDRLEILDQRVRVEYEIAACPMNVGTYRCRASADVPVGDDNRLKMRLQVHLLRSTPGGTVVGGTTAPNVRRNLLKWLRRTYAQANMSLRFVAPEIDEIDPLENLISIYNPGRSLTAGGGLIRVRVNTAPNPTEVRHNMVANETPIQVANDLAAQIGAIAGFRARAFENPLAWNNGLSADIIVIRTDGNRVVLSGAHSGDTRTRIRIGRHGGGISSIATTNYQNIGSPAHRVLARNHALDANLNPNPQHALDALHIYVINRLEHSLLGWAYIRDADQAAQFRGAPPVVGVCFVNAEIFRPNDHWVQTVSHELGHVLGDQEHFLGRNFELMTNQGMPTTNHVWNPKRLTHRDLSYNRQSRDLTGFTARNTINPVEAVRTREAGFLEAWPRRPVAGP